MSLALTVYSDYICPFCFLHHEVLRTLMEPEALQVRWVNVEIHPDTPAAGRSVRREGAYARKWDAYIGPFADEHGITLQFPDNVPNTRQALLATAWADDRGRGSALHSRIMRAYWQEGRDIGDGTVLMDLAQTCGLEDMDSPAAWQTAEYEAQVTGARDTAADDFATGFPTTMLGQFPLVGLQSPADLRVHLSRYRGLLARQGAALAD